MKLEVDNLEIFPNLMIFQFNFQDWGEKKNFLTLLLDFTGDYILD